MKDNAVETLKDLLEDLISDKKALIKIMSIVLILLIAAVLRIHSANQADITVAGSEEGTIETEESSDNDEPDDDENADDTSGESVIIYVDISGAVAHPGVYQVAEGTRLYEVVELAGGLNKDADADYVNQAAFVEDGQKVIIPVRGASAPETLSDASGSGAGSSTGLININSASKDELKTLNGIGDVMAERIIEYRSSNAFKSKEDLMSVKGIGTGTYEKIKDDITV